MDKNAFETYEYLPANNDDAEADQFLVIQDDGSFLLNRQVQYVAQVENVKEALDGGAACAVYDVEPQQYFVDVTDNSELISVADNYILPVSESEVSNNNLYGNSFLLQTVPNENSEKRDQNAPLELKGSIIQEKIEHDIEQTSNCTQITITDEQYKTLQKKGWVLLEASRKIYFLDSFGLHDITANQDLIHNLRNGNNFDAETTRSPKIEIELPTLKLENIIDDNQQHQQDPVDFTLAQEQAKGNISETNLVSENEDRSRKEPGNCFVKQILNVTRSASAKSTTNKEIDLKDNFIKIKTKYRFRDIPDKIVLGKTMNGKNLVAKVIKDNHVEEKYKEHSITPEVVAQKSDHISGNPEDTNKVNQDEDSRQFENLLQRVLHGEIKCGEDQVAAAKDIIAQLFHVPAFQSSVAGRNVIITKVVEKKLEDVTVQVENATSFVTGVITSIVGGSCCFVHVPDLLQKLMSRHLQLLESKPSNASRSVLKPRSQEDFGVLHVHISETKYENNTEAISVILNERLLPWKALVNKPIQPRQANKLYACSSCATIFQSNKELLEHQETHYLEAEDALTIDTDKLPKNSVAYNIIGDPYYMVKTDKGTEYVCCRCATKFNKLSNCLRHVKSHTSPQRPDSESDDKPEQSKEKKTLYKCKMCACSYFHSSSLSKHISKAHITHKVVNKSW